MKYALVLALGILTGVAFSRIPHYINQYADHSLPPEYTGPKTRHWDHGVEVLDWRSDDPINFDAIDRFMR